MAGCAGIKPDGSRCRGIAARGSDYCPAHDPARSDARRRSASKAARSKPHAELAGVRHQLQDLADSVLSGSVDRADASVAGQLLNVKLRALEQERRLVDQAELIERLEVLEAAAANTRTNPGGRRWTG